MKTAVNLIVIGNLYKSGFRFYAQKKGIDLGIVGTIAYYGEYGDVSIHAEGEEEDIKQFIDWCTKGLPYCKVQNVNVEEAPLMNFPGFDILTDTPASESNDDYNIKPGSKNFVLKIFGF